MLIFCKVKIAFSTVLIHFHFYLKTSAQNAFAALRAQFIGPQRQERRGQREVASQSPDVGSIYKFGGGGETVV